MSKYSVEEVRAMASDLRGAPGTSMIGTHISLPTARAVAIYEALCAYAERIEADESAVPAAWQYRYKNDHMQWSRWIEWVPEEHPESPFPKMIGRWKVEYRKLFTHPPEQAAQVEAAAIDTIALRAAEEIALMWGQDRSQFVAKIQVRIISALQQMRDAPLFGDASALAEWLESLHECNADGAVGGRKWEPAQIAAKAVREAARLTQPAQSVDVEKVREVIAELGKYEGDPFGTAKHQFREWADKLTAALQEKGNG